MIHYTHLEEISPKEVLGVIYGTLIDLKQDPDHSYKVIDSTEIEPTSDLSGMIDDMARRIVSLGTMLDKSHRLAYTDSITGLPNLLAAMVDLDETIRQAALTERPFVILLIDGDNLSKYNKLGYLAGDEMIERLGKSLQGELRPVDFIARWRMGDEFLVILKGASLELALSVAERLRRRISEVSQEWAYPITISQGVAGFPEHGRTLTDLLHYAEQALSSAKEAGKNRVVVDNAKLIDQAS